MSKFIVLKISCDELLSSPLYYEGIAGSARRVPSLAGILSENNSRSIFIPPGFAHGFCSLDKENYVIYSCTKYRDSKSEVAIRYNDKKLKIKWPIKKPLVSKKDKHAISFIEFVKKYA